MLSCFLHIFAQEGDGISGEGISLIAVLILKKGLSRISLK